MPEVPLISVVTPSFNQAEFLEATLESVFSQNYPNLEYIVMDGGSTDGSVEILERFSDRLTHWESGPDGGQSAAIRKGFGMAKGEFLMWINSDDRLAPGCLCRLLEQGHLEEQDLIVGDCVITDENGQKIKVIHSTIQTLDDLLDLQSHWFSRGQIVQPETLIPASMYRKTHGLNPDNFYTMDYELWGDLLDVGCRIRKVDIPIGIFRSHSRQKIANLAESTRSLIASARRVTKSSSSLGVGEQKRILRRIRDFETSWWAGWKGRLSCLGLPPRAVMWIRKLKYIFSGNL